MIGVAVVALLLMLDLGIDPFGSVGLDRPWSRCGLTMCACDPDGALALLVAQPACPLCPESGELENPAYDSALCDAVRPSGTTGRAVLVRRSERLGGDLPMLTELLSASLVLRLGGTPVTIRPPTACGVARADRTVNPVSRGLEIEPPPPRG